MGLNVDTALFTITVVGTPEDAAQLVERLRALPKVPAQKRVVDTVVVCWLALHC